jgi:hypothetical protein
MMPEKALCASGPRTLSKVAGLFFAPTGVLKTQESPMAKSQKRSSREVRKPKAVKVAAPAATGSLMTKGLLTPVTMPKKKG